MRAPTRELGLRPWPKTAQSGGLVREREARLERAGASDCWAIWAENREGGRFAIFFSFFFKADFELDFESSLNLNQPLNTKKSNATA
jgi:hypothetical protein